MSQFPTFKTTPELPAAGTLDRTELLEIIQDGQSKKVLLHEALHRDIYDLKVVAGVAADGNGQQVVRIDNSTSAQKTVTITNAPAGRAMTFVFVINGGVGNVVFPGNIVWDKNTQPKPGTTRTVVVVFWDGVNFTGNQGPTA